MTTRAAPLLALALGLAAAAPLPSAAAPAPTPSRNVGACFPASEVASFAVVDDRTVNILVGVREVYQLKLFAPCFDVDWADAIGLRAFGGDWICESANSGAELFSRSSTVRNRCPVTSVRKLTPDQVSALPRGERP